MKPRLEDVFERLEPPPGGPARLRARLAAAEEPRSSLPLRPPAWVAAAAVAASLVVLVVLAALEPPARRATDAAIPPPGPVAAAAPEARLPGTHPAFAALGLEPPPSEPVAASASAGGALALQRVPLADERVVFYLVAAVGP